MSKTVIAVVTGAVWTILSFFAVKVNLYRTVELVRLSVGF